MCRYEAIEGKKKLIEGIAAYSCILAFQGYSFEVARYSAVTHF